MNAESRKSMWTRRKIEFFKVCGSDFQSTVKVTERSVLLLFRRGDFAFPLDEWRGLTGFTPKGSDHIRGLGHNGMIGGGVLGASIGSMDQHFSDMLVRGQEHLPPHIQLGYSPSAELVRALNSPANMNGSIAYRHVGGMHVWSPHNAPRGL